MRCGKKFKLSMENEYVRNAIWFLAFGKHKRGKRVRKVSK